MGKKSLSKSEIKGLNEKLVSYGVELSKKEKVEILDERIILVDNKPRFVILGEKIFPTLKLILEKPVAIKKIVVDMGAVRFVASGADVMRPGIVEVEDGIFKGDVVSVVDLNNKKPLALGEALFSSEEMKSMTSGKAVKSLHYVGDKIWKEEF